MLVATLDHSSSRQVMEFGLVLMLLGGVALVTAVHPQARKAAVPVAGGLLAVGALLALVSVHWGVSPFVGRAR